MSKVRRAVLFQMLGLALAAAVIFTLMRVFPVIEWITRVQEKIGQMEFWSAVLYPLFFAACNVLLLPAGIVAMGSGLFFGLWWGVFLNILGSTAGAAAAFFLSRKLGRSWFERRFFQHRKWAALDDAIAQDGWKIIFLSQVHPLFPTSLLNYLYGVTRIRFGTCMLWIALGQAPGLFLYAYLGTLAQFGIKMWRGQTHPHPHEFVFWIGGFVLTIAVTTQLARIALRLLAKVEAASREAAEPLAEPQPAGTARS